MKVTKIDWCDCTINPVVGCQRGCEYCYACKMNCRFGWVEDFSKPQFFPERLKQLKSKKPKSIFLNSMSDIAFWEQNQLGIIGKAIRENPQHKYIMLTKDYNIFTRQFNVFQACNYPNVFIGATATTQKQADELGHGASFINIEPILEPIKLKLPYKTITGLLAEKNLELIIIGAETGIRKGKVIPEKEWVDSIVAQADEYDIGVFMKSSLRDIMGEDFRQDPLMWR